MKTVEERIKKLEEDSHPPVDWMEIISSSIIRIEALEMDTHEFMDIIKHLVEEKRDLQKRLDIMEEILHSYIPEINKNKD